MAIRNKKVPTNFHELFSRLEELVLANSGADEFEEIFKLVFAKLYDELTYHGKNFKQYQDPATTHKEISILLRDAIKNWSGIFAPATVFELDPEHLVVCVDLMKNYSMSESGLQVMDDAFENLISKASKGSKGQFFTPRHVIDFCIKMLEPTIDETVCDPACGSGAFLFHSFQYISENNKSLQPEEILRYSEEKLWGFEYSGKTARVAKALMLIAGIGGANIFKVNSLNKDTRPKLNLSTDTKQLAIEDLLKINMPKFNGFDIILANPPYAGEIKQEELLNEYDVAKLVGIRVERDTLFIERCIQLLKPGGRMAIVIPDNKVSGKSFDRLRKWINSQCQINAVVGLPRTAFMPHTSQKTSILFLRKRVEKETPLPNESIFFGISENIGKDSRGKTVHKSKIQDTDLTNAWDSIDHDLSLILDEYRAYRRTLNGANI